MIRFLSRLIGGGCVLSAFLLTAGCAQTSSLTNLSQLASGSFAVPAGTAADKLVLSKFPQATFQYYATVSDAAQAVKSGKADAVAYDEPILRNVAARNEGLRVLPEMITVDHYGVAVQPGNPVLKKAIDTVLADLRKSGQYDQMQARWLPAKGRPAAMPTIDLSGKAGVLRLGTAAVTEPFSFVDASGRVIGFDIELAQRVAQQQGKRLEIVTMEFGALIPALLGGKVDMIAALITITPERSQQVLFSEPYYKGGIAALVRKTAP